MFQNVAQKVGVVCLIPQDGFHHVTDHLAVTQLGAVGHYQQREIQLLRQRYQCGIHLRHYGTHIIQHKTGLPHLRQSAQTFALGVHIGGNGRKAGKHQLTARKTAGWFALLMQGFRADVFQHIHRGDGPVQVVEAGQQGGLTQAGQYQRLF